MVRRCLSCVSNCGAFEEQGHEMFKEDSVYSNNDDIVILLFYV